MSLFKNTLYITTASILQKIIAFGYFLIVAHVLSEEQLGFYALLLSWVVLTEAIADVGLTSVIIRSVAKQEVGWMQTVRKAFTTRLYTFVFSFLFIGTIVTFGRDLVHTLASVGGQVLGQEALAALGAETNNPVPFLFATAILLVFSDILSTFYYGILRGRQRLGREAAGMLIGQLCTLLAGGAVLLFGGSLFALVGALTCGSLINGLLVISALVKEHGWEIITPVKNPFDRALYKAALPFFLASVFVKLYTTFDVQFLLYYLGPAAVAVYTIAYKYTYAFQFLPIAFSAALYPKMSALIAENNKPKLAQVFQKSIWYMCLIGFPIAGGLMMVAPKLLPLLSPKYTDAIIPLQFLVFALIPSFLDFPVGSLLNAAGAQNKKTAIFGFTCVLNFFANAFLIPKFGILGAVYASQISLWVMFLVGFSFVHKYIPLFGWWQLVKTSGPFVLSVACMMLVVAGVQAVAPVYLAVPIGAITYILCLFLFRAVSKTEVAEIFTQLKPNRTV